MDAYTLTVSDWRSAPLEVDRETLFAIGDVHGCHGQLSVLLARFSDLSRTARRSRLIFLGDLISRGPSSLDALALWAAPALDDSFDRVHRLWGNHEQLLMLSLVGGNDAEEARGIWLNNGGDTVLKELQDHTARRGARLTRDLLATAAGGTCMDRLDHLECHVRIGNALFVHGGLNPAVPPEIALAPPWTEFDGDHWAWIRQPFISWRGGFGGLMVIHGHTPPNSHRRMSGYPDPHVFQHDRLSLDGGSAMTGIVAAAQIEDGQYRLFLAQPV